MNDQTDPPGPVPGTYRAAFLAVLAALEDADLHPTSIMCLLGNQISIVTRPPATEAAGRAVFAALGAPPPLRTERSVTGGPRIVGPVPAHGLTALSITITDRSDPS